MKLTPKQQAFAEYYLQCGNASEAARLAGYSKRTAGSIGDENLTKPAIRQYIQEHMEVASGERIATADEVMEYFTRVMRGEEKDAFGLDVSISDRNKAAEALGKRYGLFTEKLNIGGAVPVVISGDDELED